MLFFVAIKLNLPRQIDEMAVRLRIKGDEDDGNWFNNDENRSWGFPRNHLLGLNRASSNNNITCYLSIQRSTFKNSCDFTSIVTGIWLRSASAEITPHGSATTTATSVSALVTTVAVTVISTPRASS